METSIRLQQRPRGGESCAQDKKKDTGIEDKKKNTDIDDKKKDSDSNNDKKDDDSNEEVDVEEEGLKALIICRQCSLLQWL